MTTLDSIEQIEMLARELAAKLDNLHGAIVPVPQCDSVNPVGMTANERLEAISDSLSRSNVTMDMLCDSFYRGPQETKCVENMSTLSVPGRIR